MISLHLPNHLLFKLLFTKFYFKREFPEYIPFEKFHASIVEFKLWNYKIDQELITLRYTITGDVSFF